MARILYSVILVVWAAQLAASGAAVLRSAEHADFTRIVLDLDNPNGVTVSQRNRLLQVKLPADVKNIASKDFFRRISRETIASISVDDAALRIDLRLTCTCSFKKFVSGSKMLVIDISKNKQSDPIPEQTLKLTSWGLSRINHDARLAYNEAEPTPTALEIEASKPVKASVQLPIVLPNRRISEGNFSRQRMLSNLDETSGQSATFRPELQHVWSDEQIEFRSNQVVQSRALPEIEQGVRVEFGHCEKFSYLDPTSWPKYDNATSFLSAQRARVARDDLDISDSSIRSLGIAYISLAMGAEARSLLKAIAEPLLTDEYLIEISKLVDGDTDIQLHRAANCPEMIIWKLLYEAGAKQGEMRALSLNDTQLEKIRAGFDQWPRALQGVFAAKLAKSLIAADAPDTAAFSLRRSQSAPEQRSGERAMIAANLANKTESASAAIKLLAPIVASDSETAPEAAIALTDLILGQDQNISSSQKAALDTYREEYEGTELEQGLIRARLRTAIQENDFAQAIDLMRAYSKLVRPSKVNLILDEIGQAIVSLTSDASFLKEAVSLPPADFNQIAQPLQDQIGLRMKELGFSDLAAQLGALRNDPAEAVTSEDRESSIEQIANGTSQKQQRAEALALAKETPRSTLDPAPAVNSRDAADTVSETPISKAVRATQSVLESVTTLKNDIAQLGL